MYPLSTSVPWVWSGIRTGGEGVEVRGVRPVPPLGVLDGMDGESLEEVCLPCVSPTRRRRGTQTGEWGPDGRRPDHGGPPVDRLPGPTRDDFA